jgi:hypothetical protein
VTLHQFVTTMIALERRRPVSLPADWSSIRDAWLGRLRDDLGTRSEYRACYDVLASDDGAEGGVDTAADGEANEAPATTRANAEALATGTDAERGEPDFPMPVVERAMATFQLASPTTVELEDPAFDPDKTQMPHVSDVPALPFRDGAATAPEPLPIERASDAGATIGLAAPEDMKAQILAIRRVVEMSIDAYAELRASLEIARAAGGEAAEGAVWSRAGLPRQADQEALRRRFFALFRDDPTQRDAFERALGGHLLARRSRP